MSTPTNRSIVKAFDLVDMVCSAPNGLSLREAAAAAKLSLAATHRILVTLKSVGALDSSHNGTYKLGPRLLALYEQDMQTKRAVQELVASHIKDMLSGPGMCVRLSVFDVTEIYIFAGADTCENPKVHSEVGARYEAYCCAPGKVLLAGLTARKLADYLFSAEFVALTSKTIVVPSRLAEEIKRVQIAGYAVDNGEFFDGVRAVSVPVRMGDGQVVAALSLAGVAMPLDNIGCVVSKLTAGASSLAKKLSRIPGSLRVLNPNYA